MTNEQQLTDDIEISIKADIEMLEARIAGMKEDNRRGTGSRHYDSQDFEEHYSEIERLSNLLLK